MVRHLGVFAAVGIMLCYLFVVVMCAVSFRFVDQQSASRVSALNGGLKAISRWVISHPKPIVAGFVIITLAVSVWGAPKVDIDGRLLTYFHPSSPLRKDTLLLEQRMGGIAFGEIALEGKPGTFLDGENLARLEQVSREIEVSGLVDDVVTGASLATTAGRRGNGLRHFFTEDFSTARISYTESSSAAEDERISTGELERRLAKAFPACDIRFTGYGALAEKANENVVGTLLRSLVGAFAMVSLLLVTLFGIKGGLISLLPNWGAVALLPGLMGLMGYKLNIGTAIIASVTIGIVVDDTIHTFWSYREAMRRQGDVQRVLMQTIRQVGRPMVITSLMFILGLNVFLVSKLTVLRDFGLLASIIVLFALAYDLFFASALIRLFRLYAPEPSRAKGPHASVFCDDASAGGEEEDTWDVPNFNNLSTPSIEKKAAETRDGLEWLTDGLVD
jgi:predicted RND superfamily exporter protein